MSTESSARCARVSTPTTIRNAPSGRAETGRNQNVFQNADLVEPFGKHLVQLVVRRFAFSSDGRQLNHVEGSTPFPGIVVLFNAAPKPLLPAVRVAVRSLNQMLGVEFLLGFLKGGAVKIRENATEGLVFPGRFKVALTRRN